MKHAKISDKAFFKNQREATAFSERNRKYSSIRIRYSIKKGIKKNNK